MNIKETKHGPREYSAMLVDFKESDWIFADNPQGIGKTADEALGDLILGIQRNIDFLIYESKLKNKHGNH